MLFILLYYIQRKIFFGWSFFLYSPCPNVEGIKDALCYKFRRPTIGQNWSAVCTNQGGHRDASSNEQCEARRVSRASREARDEVCSLSEDSTFEQSKNVAIAVVSFSSCCIEGCGLLSNRFKVHAAACARHVLTALNGWYTARIWEIDFLWAYCELDDSCILATLSHD